MSGPSNNQWFQMKGQMPAPDNLSATPSCLTPWATKKLIKGISDDIQRYPKTSPCVLHLVASCSIYCVSEIFRTEFANIPKCNIAQKNQNSIYIYIAKCCI